MAMTSIGDLSRSLILRQANVATKSELTARAREVTTGIHDDIAAALGGDTRGLGQVEARLAALAAYDRSSGDLARQAEGMQHVLETMQGVAQSLGANLVQTASLPSPHSVAAGLVQARQQLSDVVGQINISAGGRFLFSGTDVTTAPLPAADDLLAATRAAIGSPATAGDLIAAVSAFFDAPPGAGGFSDSVYQGDPAPITAAIAPGQNAALNANATSPAIREMLKGMTLLALATEAPWSGDTQAQARIMHASGEALLAADGGLSLLRGDVGTTESALARAQTRNSAESTALNLNRTAMIGVDRYEAASAVAEAEARMEAIYSLTARLSRLSLAAYL